MILDYYKLFFKKIYLRSLLLQENSSPTKSRTSTILRLKTKSTAELNIFRGSMIFTSQVFR